MLVLKKTLFLGLLRILYTFPKFSEWLIFFLNSFLFASGSFFYFRFYFLCPSHHDVVFFTVYRRRPPQIAAPLAQAPQAAGSDGRRHQRPNASHHDGVCRAFVHFLQVTPAPPHPLPPVEANTPKSPAPDFSLTSNLMALSSIDGRLLVQVPIVWELSSTIHEVESCLTGYPAVWPALSSMEHPQGQDFRADCYHADGGGHCRRPLRSRHYHPQL
jgi:hypothetical protein